MSGCGICGTENGCKCGPSLAAEIRKGMRTAPGDLTYREFQRINAVRCKAGFKSSVDDWNPLEWAGAICGEAGELANLCKKIRRGDKIDLHDVADEIADVMTYLDLLATRLGIDVEEALRSKFNSVSLKRGCAEIMV